MMHRRIPLPEPWYFIEVFALQEPVRQDDANTVYCKRLYMVNPIAPGGRILLDEGPEIVMPTPAMQPFWKSRKKAQP